MNRIPVIGTAVVNNPSWLHRLIESIDYPVEELVIMNNNGRGEITEELDLISKTEHKFINKIKVCHLPYNIGCSGAWNLIIKSYMLSPYWIIVNHDVQFSPGVLEKFHLNGFDTVNGLVHSDKSDLGLGMWDLFLIKDWVVQKCGLFDENLYPAYGEDADYIMRILNTGVQFKTLDTPYLHGEEDYKTTGSQTWRSDLSLKDKLHNSLFINENEYLNKKWGEGWRMCSPFKTPFNNSTVDNTHTTYDLKFVRRKHLGF